MLSLYYTKYKHNSCHCNQIRIFHIIIRSSLAHLENFFFFWVDNMEAKYKELEPYIMSVQIIINQI